MIPPNADLCFDVELLDINHQRTLERYRETLVGWMAGKLQKFDTDEAVSKKLGAKHGGREGYVRHLENSVAEKYESEHAKRQPSGNAHGCGAVGGEVAGGAAGGSDGGGVERLAAAAEVELAAEKLAGLGVNDAGEAAALNELAGVASAQAAEGEGAEGAAGAGTLTFDVRFATIKVRAAIPMAHACASRIPPFACPLTHLRPH